MHGPHTMKLLLFCLGFCALSLSASAASAANTPVKNEVKFTGTYYLPDQLTKRPVAKQQAVPRYPSEMSRERLHGQVEVAFIINEKGVTEEVQVATATNPSFADAALVAVKQWRFKPGLKDGVAVRALVLQRLEFEMAN
ncbi:MAG: TonB family protein [Lacunisphaera sp.]|nr:TonB family protein [Lacunisphaera sp.]